MNKDTYGFSEDFQKSIIAAVLKDPSFLLQFEDVLLPGYLDYEYLSSILRVARDLFNKYKEVPGKEAVVEEIKDFCVKFNIDVNESEFVLNKLEELYVLDSYNLEFIKSKVVEFGQRQSLKTAILKIVNLFKSSKDNVYDEARTTLESALQVGSTARDLGIDLYPMLNDIPRLAAQSSSGLTRKIPTLIPTLDAKSMGGPGRGEVWFVMALPGRGKSAFLINIGAAALKGGFAVVHFTIGDLNEVDTGVRYAARLTRSSILDVVTGSESYHKKASLLSKYNPHLFIKYFPSGTATMNHVRSTLSRIKATKGFNPSLVIIDYPEELRPLNNSHSDNLYLSGADNYSAMNAIAAEFDVLVWAASQPRRWKPENPTDVITIDNVGDSWKKPQKADGVCSWNMSYEEEMQGRGRLWVDKTRRAKSFYLIHMKAELDRMTITETTPPKET